MFRATRDRHNKTNVLIHRGGEFSILLVAESESVAEALAAQINAGAEAQDAAAKERERIVRLCERAKGIIITHGTVASALLAIDDVLGAIRGDHESEVGG